MFLSAAPFEEEISLQYEAGKGWWPPGSEASTTAEFAAFEWFRQRGWQGSYCEGGAILTLIKCASFEELPSQFYSHFIEAIYYIAARPLEECPYQQILLRADQSLEEVPEQLRESARVWSIRLEQLLECVRQTTEQKILQNFRRAYSREIVQERFPGLSEETIAGLYRALGRQRLESLAEIFSSDPYGYRAGWPDLTLFQGQKIEFLEVKTPSDTLRPSQQRIFREILFPLGLVGRIVRLRPMRRSG